MGMQVPGVVRHDDAVFYRESTVDGHRVIVVGVSCSGAGTS